MVCSRNEARFQYVVQYVGREIVFKHESNLKVVAFGDILQTCSNVNDEQIRKQILHVGNWYSS